MFGRLVFERNFAINQMVRYINPKANSKLIKSVSNATERKEKGTLHELR